MLIYMLFLASLPAIFNAVLYLDLIEKAVMVTTQCEFNICDFLPSKKVQTQNIVRIKIDMTKTEKKNY